MKSKFWFYVILLIAGAVSAGYGSGMYHGRMDAQQDTRNFLQEFRTSTGVDSYLEQKNQDHWSKRLQVYGYVGPDSYTRAGRKWINLMTVGLIGFSLGLVGLARLNFQPKIPVALESD